jgi:hypothetical protein
MEKYANIIVRTFIRLSTPSMAWGLVTKKGGRIGIRFKNHAAIAAVGNFSEKVLENT